MSHIRPTYYTCTSPPFTYVRVSMTNLRKQIFNTGMLHVHICNMRATCTEDVPSPCTLHQTCTLHVCRIMNAINLYETCVNVLMRFHLNCLCNVHDIVYDSQQYLTVNVRYFLVLRSSLSCGKPGE